MDCFEPNETREIPQIYPTTTAAPIATLQGCLGVLGTCMTYVVFTFSWFQVTVKHLHWWSGELVTQTPAM